ncbi:hypothetical protein ACOKFD_14945 [Flagellimonas sp. S174]|uniref:hypothetical protein n=1 Tax=Flagellimonas sp. S174 TaxID=3410790 RepID=UPI003BF52F93
MGKAQKENVSKIRKYLMKGLYLLTFIGVGYQAWAEVIAPETPLETIDGIVYSFWVAYATLMALGLRYPLKMVPLLLLQLFYKAVWILGVYLPMERNELVTESAEGFLTVCITAIILDVLIIPWKYVYHTFLKNLFRFNPDT